MTRKKAIPLYLILIALTAGVLHNSAIPPDIPGGQGGGEPQSFAETKIMTWNLYEFDSNKSDTAMNRIARIMKDYHLIAVQEIETTPAGLAGISTLRDKINEECNCYFDYQISFTTNSSSSAKEKYAYLYDTTTIKIDTSRLISEFESIFSREPFYVQAIIKETSDTISLFNFHLSTSSQQYEALHLNDMVELFPNEKIILLGDFNLGPNDIALSELKSKSYGLALQEGNKTSLKRKLKNGEYKSREYDNIIFEENEIRINSAQVIDFYRIYNYTHPLAAREISDHLPVSAIIETKIQENSLDSQ